MRTLTERGYQGLYSLVALVTVVYLVMAYNDAPRLEYLWNLDPRLYWVPKLLMLPAFVLFAGGLKGAAQTASPLPGCATDEAALAKLTSGINRVTRHPVQWAFILWAASHIIANGDAESVVFFAVFLLLSAVRLPVRGPQEGGSLRGGLASLCRRHLPPALCRRRLPGATKWLGGN